MEWTPEDRAKALAFAMEENSRCQMCGTADWEWDENPYAYEPIARRCQGCYLKDTAQEDSKNLPGTTIVLEPASAISMDERERRFEYERRTRQDELADLSRSK